VAHFIESQARHFIIPREVCEEVVQVLADISKASEILAKLDDDFGTYSFRICYELKFMKSSASCFIVACDYNLLLLHSKR
jgi:hypothetical protein